MDLNLLLFSSAKTLANDLEKVQVTLPANTAVNGRQLAEIIYQQHPFLLPLKGKCMLAVDLRYIENLDEPLELTQASELVFIPPVSGG